MTSSLSNLVNNRAKGIHRIKWKHAELSKKVASAFLNTETLNII